MDFQTQKTYQLALHFVKGLGPTTYMNLLEEYGSAEAVFDLKEDELSAIIPKKKAVQAILDKSTLKLAETEFAFCQANGINIINYSDKAFPKRILYYDNTPRLLFFKGNTDLNTHKIISIVGTRQATERGKIHCQKIIESLIDHRCLIVSGLAYGVDINAHKMALKYGLPTVGVVAHGLDNLYPKDHSSTAKKCWKMEVYLLSFLLKLK